MAVSIENRENLRVKYLTSKDSNKSSNKEKKLLGLCISAGGDDENSCYVYGTLNDFMAFLGNYEGAKPLCKGYGYIELSFAYGASMNEIIYKYMHKEILGKVIIFKSDQSDIDQDIHRNLIKICRKTPKVITKCDYCCHIITETKKNYRVNICYFITCNKTARHSHYFCSFCYNNRLHSYKNKDYIKKNEKFLKQWWEE